MRMSVGTRIEKTIFAHALVKGFKTTFAFKSTAYDVGDRFGRDADKVRVEVDNEVVRVCGALYRLTSELERNPRGQTWYGPRFEKLGILGRQAGPRSSRFAWRVICALRSSSRKRRGKRNGLRSLRSSLRRP